MAIIRAVVSQPYLLLTLTTMMWAGNAIAGKFAVGHVSPFLMTTLRWSLALCILLPFALGRLRNDWSTVRAHIAFLFVMGALGFTLFNNLLYFSLIHTTAINAAIIQSATPLFIFVFSFLAFGQRVSARQLFGFLLTVIGVVLTVTRGDPSMLFSSGLNMGDILMVIAACFYAGYSVALIKRPKLHWLTFITVLATAAFFISIPFTLFEWWSGNLIPPDKFGWLLAGYVVLFPSIAAQLLWVRGLELIGANRGGIFMNLVPVFAVLMAIVLLGERVLPFHLAAMALVLGGIWMAQKQPATHTPVS